MKPFPRSKATGAPTMMAFKDAFLQAIGRATGYVAGSALPLHLIRLYTYQIFSETYGVDLSQWERAGRQPQGLDVKVQVLPLALSRTDGRNARGTLLTEPGDKRGYWSLTDEGIEQALALDGLSESENLSPARARIRAKRRARLGSKSPHPNLTARWLNKQFTAAGAMENSPLYKALEGAIASKCPVSASSSMIDDHISEFVTRLIHRDSLRNRIMTGRPITTSHLCSYAVRSAWSDARNSGTNPVCREIYGARTETERKKAAEDGTDDRRWGIDDPKVVITKGEDGVAQLLDIAVNDHDMIEDSLYFEALWTRILDEIVGSKAGARYQQVLMLKLAGHTTQDIALELNVSQSRATTLISNARKIIKDARDAGALDKYLN